MRPILVSLATASFAAVISMSASAFADQFVVMDETWEHTKDMPDSHYRVDPAASAPDDWSSYADGSVWVYLEVQTKPTDAETRFQVCFEATPTYACTLPSPIYATTGTVEWESRFDQFWSPPGEHVDWSLGTQRIACILKDTMNHKPSADNVGDEVAALYTPTRVRMVVTVVQAGSTYVPPTPTNLGEGGGGGGATTIASSSAGLASSHAVVSTSAGATTSAATGGTTSGAGGAGGAPPTDDGREGCTVTARDAGEGWAWLFAAVVVGAPLARRRGRSA